MEGEDLQPGGHQLVVVGEQVLLLAHDHQVGPQLDDGGEVGVLGTADVGQIGPLAEPGTSDRVSPPASQAFGGGGNQADHPHQWSALCSSIIGRG